MPTKPPRLPAGPHIRLLTALLPVWLLALLLTWPLLLGADAGTAAAGPGVAAEPVRRLLILDSQFGNPYDEVRAALLDQLAQYGYRQGGNLQISLHAAGNDQAAAEQLLVQSLNQGYDVIYVGGTVATIAAQRALLGKSVPVVFAAPTDPVGIGVIDGFEQPPKANFTGVCYPAPPKARLRFVRQLMPQARTLGLIHADMPQSHSYNRWLKELIEQDPEFKDLRILFRPVPLITGEDGDRRMAELALPLIAELDGQVDAFIKPNDQLGTRQQFAEVVSLHAKKPLIGLVKSDVTEGWGATAVIYPSHDSIGRQAARMIRDLFQGKPIAEIQPEWPRLFGYAVDLAKTRSHNIQVPIGILQLAGKNVVR
ncbi:MAG: hypothetical protein H7842_08225 [Gammaproteobacteria bacterium SHHR-1]